MPDTMTSVGAPLLPVNATLLDARTGNDRVMFGDKNLTNAHGQHTIPQRNQARYSF